MKHSLGISAIAAAVFLTLAGPASAQVAGSTVVGVTVTESSQLALGWSVKRSILDKNVYNDAGEKVGKVVDLIITPEKKVSYAIVGAGGFVGIGRHDVAIPAAQLSEKGGRIILAGATKDVVKGLPAFDYTNDTSGRDQLVARAESDIAKGKEKITELRGKAAAATAGAKVNLDASITRLQADLKGAEARVADLKKAGAGQWKSFEGAVSTAIERLRKSLETVTS